jgi:hypothetical protein
MEFALEWGNLSTTFSAPSILKYSLLSCGGFRCKVGPDRFQIYS